VYDALLVSRLESFSDLECQLEGFFDRDGPVLQAVCQRISLDELQNQEPAAFVLFESVDGSDVGMVQGCKQLRFAFEPRKSVWVLGKLRRERFDGDFSTQLGIPGTIHLAHAALAERGGDFVVAEPFAGFQCHGALLGMRAKADRELFEFNYRYASTANKASGSS
jgi:hypothetical protein